MINAPKVVILHNQPSPVVVANSNVSASDIEAVKQALLSELRYLAQSEASREAFTSTCRWLAKNSPLDMLLLFISDAITPAPKRDRLVEWLERHDSRICLSLVATALVMMAVYAIRHWVGV